MAECKPLDLSACPDLADPAQIGADAATHSHEAARDRVLKEVKRLKEIARGDLPPALLAKLPKNRRDNGGVMTPAAAKCRVTPPYGELQLDERRVHGIYR